MTEVFQDNEGVLVWKDIKSASKLKKCLDDYFSDNLSSKDVTSLRITDTDLNILSPELFLEFQDLIKLEINSCSWTGNPEVFALLGKITELWLERNKIKEITGNSFENFPRLEILTLRRMEIIEKIGKNVFSPLQNLKKLIIVDNYIEETNPDVLEGLNNPLEEILIESTCIHNIPKEIFQGLNKIKKITLKYLNNSSSLPGLFFNLTNLEYIELINIPLYHLKESSFNKLNNLVVLKLVCTRINEIDRDVFKDLNSLTELNLSHNQLTTLNEEIFQKLTSLKILDLEGNFLETTPKISNLTNLKSLFLKGNQIKTLKENDFKGLEGLLSLNLAKNNLCVLEKNSFKNLSSLFLLNLEDNKFQTIKSFSFNGLGKLHSLNLSKNFIKTLEKDWFEGLNNLKTLDLGNNSILEFNPEMFQLSSLTTLSLHQNRIKNIKNLSLKKLKSLDLSSNLNIDLNLIFEGLEEVQFLNLRNTRLKKVEKLSEEKLNELVFLDISYCELQDITLDMFEHFPSLKLVKVSIKGILEVLSDWEEKCKGVTFLTWQDLKDVEDYY